MKKQLLKGARTIRNAGILMSLSLTMFAASTAIFASFSYKEVEKARSLETSTSQNYCRSSKNIYRSTRLSFSNRINTKIVFARAQ